MMKTWSHRIMDLKPSRLMLHIAFWVIVFLLVTSLYALQNKYWFSFRNNLFYTPIHVGYFYVVAYLLIPRYLLQGRYLAFATGLILIMFLTTLASRVVGILFVNPFMARQLPITDWSYMELNHGNFWLKVADVSSFAAAFKGMNLVIWAALGIKLFKMWFERKQAALEAELNALKAQVHPHFLFNTLNNLYALTLQNSPKSPELVLGLSDILRYMLYECNTAMVPLKKELLMLQKYINLEKLRYEQRLDLTFNISGDFENKQIAPLLLLPFIENAFKHGASEKVGQAWINISISIDAEKLNLKVSNSKASTDTASDDQHFGNIGLKNVTKRLDLLYPAKYQLKIMDDEDTFLVVFDIALETVAVPQSQLITA